MRKRLRRHTHPDKAHKKVGLFFSDGEVNRYGEVKLGVVVVDICDDNVDCGGGSLTAEHKQ